jgi:hypothetical protein
MSFGNIEDLSTPDNFEVRIGTNDSGTYEFVYELTKAVFIEIIVDEVVEPFINEIKEFIERRKSAYLARIAAEAEWNSYINGLLAQLTYPVANTRVTELYRNCYMTYITVYDGTNFDITK